MFVKRYMILDHSIERELLHRVPAHDLLHGYHWVRLNDQHIYLLSEFHAGSLSTLDVHPAISFLPSLYSRTTVKDHLHKRNRHHHLKSIVDHGAHEDMTSYDLAEFIAAKHHCLFSPDK